MAEALLKYHSAAEGVDRVLLFSDGNFPAKIDFSLPYRLAYEQLPAAGPNLGITALNARRNDGGGWNVFVKVQGTNAPQMPATLELIQDGQSRGSQPVVLGKEGQRLIFPIDTYQTEQTDQHTSIELRLKAEGFDSLSSDNQAYLELAPTRPLWAYAPPSLPAYRHALGAMKNVQLFPEDDDTEDTRENYDLIFTDKADEPAADAHTMLYVGVVPEDLTDLLEIRQEGTNVIDWRRTSPLLEHVELGEIYLPMDEPHLRENVKEEDLENLHYEVIMYGQHGPLMLQRRDGQKLAYYMLFHSDRSTLPYRIAFPILTSNVARIAMHQAGLLEVRGDRTGVLPPLSLTAGATYEIRGPHGSTRHETADANGMLSGVPAPRVGRYVIRGGEEKALGVSMLAPSETLLTSVEQIDFDELTVPADRAAARVDHSLWSKLALIALFVLLLEWWFFQRRPGGVRA